MTMKSIAAALSIAAAPVLSACATVTTSSINSSAEDKTNIRATATASEAGIAYFLPRQLVEVTVTLDKKELNKAIEGAGEAELAFSIAKAKVAAAKQTVRETEDALVANAGNPVARDILSARLAAQREAVTKAEKGQTDAASEQEKARQAIRDAVKAADGKATIDSARVELKLLPPSPDPRFGFRMDPRHSIFRDDERKVAITTNGLLTTLNIVAADRTADILVELATAAGAALRATDGGPCQQKYVGIVDLTVTANLTKLNEQILCMGVRLDVLDKPVFHAETAMTAPQRVDGVVYRTPMDVTVQIKRCIDAACTASSSWTPTQTLALALPQAGPVSYLRQNSGFMTRTKYDLTFKDGVLINYDSNRPSELLEVARTPMRLVNGFFEGASKIISIRTGQNNARATMVQSETALQTAQLNSQTTVSAAQLAAEQALLRDQAKRDAMNRCIGERVTRGEPYDSCFAGP